MAKKWRQGPLRALMALALTIFAFPAQAQNQAGLETATQAAGDGTATFGDMLEDLFDLTPDAADAGLTTARDASATGGDVSADRLESLHGGDTALGRPLVLPPTPTPMPANIGRPPVQAGPPAGVGDGRGGRF